MAICPNGHDSLTDDFCEACGARIAPAGNPEDTCPWCGNPSPGQFCGHCGFRVRRPFPSEPQPAPVPPAPVPPASPEPAAAISWSAVPASPTIPASPIIPAPDSHSGPVQAAPPTAPLPTFTPATWSVVVTSDRTYYDQMQADRTRTGRDLPFPADGAEQRFPLTGKQVRIGRRSAARGVEPEIDLSGPLADPGISRLHALLLPAPDGSWAVLDPGSANGTLLNGREIAPGDLIPLGDGDRINLGAWTALTVRRE